KSSQKDELKAKSQGSPKTGEKSTTGQGAGEKSGMTQKDHGPAKKRETTGQGSPDSKSQQSQSPQMNQQPAQKQDQNAGKQNQSAGAPQNENAAQKPKSGFHTAVQRHHSVAGWNPDHRAAADHDPTERPVGQERAAR